MPTSRLPRWGRGSLSACPCDGVLLHASTVARGRRGALILGASGAGKSRLCLDLISRGGRLVADDATVVSRRHDARLWARCPAPIQGLIEVRGVGLMRAPIAAEVPVAVVVDLDQVQTDRLPEPRMRTYAGVQLPVLHNSESADLASALWHYLWYGRASPDTKQGSECFHDHSS